MMRTAKLLISLGFYLWDLLVSTLLTLLGRTRPPSVVVLYYHAIPDDQRRQFAHQMDELLRIARPVSAELSTPLNPGGHYCSVTFDDGFVSVIENALPEMEERHIPATLFVPTGGLGKSPAWVTPSATLSRNERILSVAELRNLRSRSLVCVGSHSVSHPNLLKVDEAQARRELSQSKADLERILGREVTLFSFPHGRCNRRLLELAKSCGYEHVYTIEPKTVSPAGHPFVLGRVYADPRDWALEFRVKLRGGYRWLSWLNA